MTARLQIAHRKYGCISSVFGSAKAEVFSPLQAVFETGKKVWQVFWDGGGQRVSPRWQVTTRTSGLNSATNKSEFARYQNARPSNAAGSCPA